jgi:hypothetical protein
VKIPLELNIVGRRVFLNFWDYNAGRDVVCQVVKGELRLVRGKRLLPFSLPAFVLAVKAAVESSGEV